MPCLRVSAVFFVGSAAAADTWGSTFVHKLGVLLCWGIFRVCMRPFEGVGVALWAAAC